MMGSLFIAELELDKEEAKKLGDAAKEVGKYYAPMLNPKYLAWANLGAVAGFVYGPRFVAMRVRWKGTRDAQRALPAPVQPSPNAAPVPPMEQPKNGVDKSVKIPVANATQRQMSPSEIFGSQEAEEFPGLG